VENHVGGFDAGVEFIEVGGLGAEDECGGDGCG